MRCTVDGVLTNINMLPIYSIKSFILVNSSQSPAVSREEQYERDFMVLSQWGSPTLQEWWSLFFNKFISLALTSTFTSDESELYNPLAGFRGQQQRGPEGRENHSLPGKNSDIQFSTWFISVKLKLIVCHYWAGSCLGEMYQSLLILI